jgi:selenide,water dikinase
VLRAIFEGGLAKLSEAGVALLGGHTVQDSEIKFGYAVTGEVHPQRVLANGGAEPGDVLLLTKPIGTGIIATALKFGRAPQPAVEAAIASMLRLNAAASQVLTSLPAGAVRACTDITGFGLVGHASEMALASGCTLEIDVEAVPLLDGARALVQGNVPGGGKTNAQHFGSGLRFESELPFDLVQLLHDPQTSGGLLASVHPEHAAAARDGMAAAGIQVHLVGRAVAHNGASVVLR